jgi:tRNA(Ile)-lysidine synthase
VPRLDLARLVLDSLSPGRRAVLAVSGGLDSMTLLHAARKASEAGGCHGITVATFDHASGPHSTKAARHVAHVSADYGFSAIVGLARTPETKEAGWREARWQFLRSIAARMNAVILTAHTRDDQIETVLMRTLRGAGARGLAALRAASDVRRPFLDVTRDDVHAYALAHDLQWTEDPTNESRNHLRNRIRHDLLPALRFAHPTIDNELLDIGARAAQWRYELASLVDVSLDFEIRRSEGGVLEIPVDSLRSHSSPALAIIWPELASRIGLVMDRRGTRRAVQFTGAGRVGARVQLSGRWELSRSRVAFALRHLSSDAPVAGQALEPPMTWERWFFARSSDSATADSWRATLPNDRGLWVRSWQPGDRLVIRQGKGLLSRKVKYFLSDAGISGHIRARWPVVLAGDEIVWIPGVRRSDAAAARSGGPVVTYVCDYLDRRS